ncbi:MAG: substrate-binding domain-containing protein [Kiritimatiellae bacterium]|nr:substrate-binding domain-containing protein [Kiritimatiellia bacterium]
MRLTGKKDGARRILVVVAEMGHNTQREISGVSAWAMENGWSVDVVEGRHFGGRPDFGRWIDFWHPDGLLVDPDYAHEALADKAARALPTVIWDAAKTPGLPLRCAKVVSDSRAVADAAVRELLRTGHQNLAFVPALGDPPYSMEREAAFRSSAAAFGRQALVYHPAAAATRRRAAPDAAGFQSGLSRFLASVCGTCGVFAANDPTAVLVMKACESSGLRVPEDVAIVGVDDTAEYCEHSDPTISSIRVDIERGGREGAALLAALAGGSGKPDRKPRNGMRDSAGRIAQYGVQAVVRRASTTVLHVQDSRVKFAVEWIRRHACERMGVAKVVAAMGCSRRLADLRFRQATGRSILDEIHARRLERAKELLEFTDIPIDDIPSRCGYVPGPYLGILFKRVTGATMRNWRKTARLS